MVVHTGAGRRSRLLLWAALGLSLLVMAGCGAPDYTYVKNSADKTYLRIPSSWQAIDSKSLFDAIGYDPSQDTTGSAFWLEGYDADAAPSASHLLGQESDAPAVFVGVRDVPPGAQGQISLDLMRDLWRPVSDSARQQDAQNPASAFSGFGLVSDEVLTPGHGVHGVHTVYRYKIMGGPSQTFDQIVYTNDDSSKIYMFYVRCSSECFDQRQQEINAVVSSFTVRENP
jgi:hypothetical protein